MTGPLVVFPVAGIPEVRAGDDLAALVCARVALEDGDVLAVTSKVVSKAAGRVVAGERAEVAAGQPGRVVARRGATVITRTQHGLVLAAAGVDASNVERGDAVVLPADPDASARSIRTSVAARSGHNVGVVITDTAGRPWRTGQTDIAVGCAGLEPVDDHAGRLDPFGNTLAVTAPAVADEVAAAADLVKGKLRRIPVAVLRGSGIAVLPVGRHGPGSAALVRPAAEDLFGLGAREAVVAAVERSDQQAMAAFAVDPVPLADLLERAGRQLDAGSVRLVAAAGTVELVAHGLVRRPVSRRTGALLGVAAAMERFCALVVAHGHSLTEEPHHIEVEPAAAPPGWLAVLRAGARSGHP